MHGKEFAALSKMLGLSLIKLVKCPAVLSWEASKSMCLLVSWLSRTAQFSMVDSQPRSSSAKDINYYRFALGAST